MNKKLLIIFFMIVLLAGCDKNQNEYKDNSELRLKLANEKIVSLQKQLDDADEKIIELENTILNINKENYSRKSKVPSLETNNIEKRKEIAEKNAEEYSLVDIDTFTNEKFIEMEYYFEGMILGFSDDIIAVLDETTNYLVDIRVNNETIREVYISDHIDETSGLTAGSYIRIYGTLDGKDYDNSHIPEGDNDIKATINAYQVYIYN